MSVPRFGDQLIHVSADLARFRTMTLQTFTREDVLLFLAQSPEDFGVNWARQFRHAGGNEIFTRSEQTWLYEQIGTHPYLLQQFCFHAFNFKREFALRRGSWGDLPTTEREQLIERVNERLGTFLDSTWKRTKASLDVSSQETRNKFYDFMAKSRGRSASEEIDPAIWNQLGLEVRYILYSEGIVRYDLLQPIYYPGAMLLGYLAQKALEQDKSAPSVMLPQSQAPTSHASELIITLPGKQPRLLELSSLEYALMKTLLHYPSKCSEEALMKSAWGKITSKQVLNQRIFHLRKKLKDICDGKDMIENIYGGFYSLNHPEWFSLLSDARAL